MPSSNLCVEYYRAQLQKVWLRKNHWKVDDIACWKIVFSKIASAPNDLKMTQNTKRSNITHVYLVLAVSQISVCEVFGLPRYGTMVNSKFPKKILKVGNLKFRKPTRCFVGPLRRSKDPSQIFGKATYPPYLQSVFFFLFSKLWFSIFNDFFVNMEPYMGAKISKRYLSHSFCPSSTLW